MENKVIKNSNELNHNNQRSFLNKLCSNAIYTENTTLLCELTIKQKKIKKIKKIHISTLHSPIISTYCATVKYFETTTKKGRQSQLPSKIWLFYPIIRCQ